MGFRLDILQHTDEWAEKLEEYGVRATVRLDDKAQQTGGLAGIFLAAAFGFMKPETFAYFGPRARFFVTGMLFFVISVLVVCVGACLTVTWLQSVPMPMSLSICRRLNSGILDLAAEDLTNRVQENYYNDRMTLWKDTLDARLDINIVKARRLRVAQGLLATGIALSAALLLVVVSSVVHWPKF